MRPEITQDQKIRSAEAEELRQNPAFQRAMLGARKRCLEDLAEVDPLDVETIRTLQARIRAISNLVELLADEIIAGKEPRRVAA